MYPSSGKQVSDWNFQINELQSLKFKHSLSIVEHVLFRNPRTQCCGNYPKRFPFPSDRGCCDNKTYNADIFECCDGEIEILLGFQISNQIFFQNFSVKITNYFWNPDFWEHAPTEAIQATLATWIIANQTENVWQTVIFTNVFAKMVTLELIAK